MLGKLIFSVSFILFIQPVDIRAIDPNYNFISRLDLIADVIINSFTDVINLDNTPIERLVTFWCVNPFSPRQRTWVNDANVQNKINISLPVVFLTHGWTDNVNRTWVNQTMDKYIANVNGNMCGVDWHRLATTGYIMASKNTYAVANYTTIFINFLLSKGLPLNSITLVGHSMGAQISGLIGNNFGGSIQRIIALDPAGWMYTKPIILPDDQRLTPNSGKFVQVLHTDDNYLGLGVSIPCGHEDYYPNGGLSPQPNCIIPILQDSLTFKTILCGILSVQMTCSHYSSVQYFMYSESPANKFVGYVCSSYLRYFLGLCNWNPHDNFGLYAQKTAAGNLYLSTALCAPFASS